ncbi:MAG: DUF1996 domain-containing protein [Gaiellaceae bacterium]
MRRRLGFWLIVVAAGSGALVAAPEQQAASTAVFPGGRYYVVGCGFSHRNNDDPIAFPGRPGRSHNHTYVGNRTVDADSTPASLRGGPSSCGDLGDSSAYWTPTLYVGQEPVRPLVGLAYYVKRTSDPIQAFPAGLKLIAGDPEATRPQSKSVVGWSCGGVGTPNRFATVPACAEDKTLQLRVDFPDCWNGSNLDSVDHVRHMAYSSAGRCPSSHPVELPTITLLFLYPPVPASAQLASGRYASHADFINGWDQDVLDFLVDALNRVGDR